MKGYISPETFSDSLILLILLQKEHTLKVNLNIMSKPDNTSVDYFQNEYFIAEVSPTHSSPNFSFVSVSG